MIYRWLRLFVLLYAAMLVWTMSEELQITRADVEFWSQAAIKSSLTALRH